MARKTCGATHGAEDPDFDTLVCALPPGHVEEQQPLPIHRDASGAEWSAAFG